jgi:hypothetical protein
VDKRAWMGEGFAAGRPVAFELKMGAVHASDCRTSFATSLFRCSW